MEAELGSVAPRAVAPRTFEMAAFSAAISRTIVCSAGDCSEVYTKGERGSIWGPRRRCMRASELLPRGGGRVYLPRSIRVQRPVQQLQQQDGPNGQQSCQV